MTLVKVESVAILFIIVLYPGAIIVLDHRKGSLNIYGRKEKKEGRVKGTTFNVLTLKPRKQLFTLFHCVRKRDTTFNKF